MDKKRILIIADSMNGGGAERVLLTLLPHLTASYEVTLLFYHLIGPLVGQLPQNVKVLSLYHPKGKTIFEKILFHTPWRHAYERRGLHRLVGQDDFHAIVSWLEGPAAVLHSHLLHRPCRHVTWVHIDMQAFPWSTRFFPSAKAEKEFYATVRCIVFVSLQAQSHFPYRVATPMQVIYNLVDTDRIQTLSRERCPVTREGFTLCFVGRLTAVKRLDRVLQAVAIVRRRGYDVHLWMVGEGEDRENVTRNIGKLNLDSCVKLTGFTQNPYPYMRECDALVLGSDAEGLPTVILEALCLGTPVVATRTAGTVQLLGQGGGLLADFTPQSMADAIERIITEPGLATRLRQEALSVASRRNDDEILGQIKELLG